MGVNIECKVAIVSLWTPVNRVLGLTCKISEKRKLIYDPDK